MLKLKPKTTHAHKKFHQIEAKKKKKTNSRERRIYIPKAANQS
jgi:hypothetical protein